ncbi:FAD-binding oxidoreductase [Aquabacterium sp. OR-4]|uniref:FAD-binding oxidoreductase n=1 Tax=Aquabacterium sp. OR-4 TaxID=2978127 RepID=UPI0028C944E7|nr:FAD-binding oxidoreductase [Aquabacterium sp. OR-4]MDT7834501.1 FAD-binding oxidoreductase [Aquabacterium sp. OR-4]
MHTITLTSGKKFDIADGESILDAATKAGVSLEHSCRTGRCNSCRSRVLSGNTRPLQAETALSADDSALGWILTCARTAGSDLQLEASDLGALQLPKAGTWPSRIQSIEKLAEDVARVRLRLPPSCDFVYLPGQYVDVVGPGGVRRSYSIANAPAPDRLIELHIRSVPGGAMSAYWFGQARTNDLLRLHGPSGSFVLRDIDDQDLCFLATGTGLAPVKAMLESLSGERQTGRPRSVTVYWGARVAEDLYWDLSTLGASFTPVPVLSRAAAGWSGARGHVQDVLLSRGPDLSRLQVYACGSEVMIRDARQRLLDAGLAPTSFHADAFVCSAPA